MAQPKTVVITGAGGALGQVIAEDFAASGFAVALIDRAEEGLADLAARLTRLGATAARWYLADQTDRAAVDQTLAQVVDDLGPVGALVANAGFARMASVEDISPTMWARHIDINLTGTFNMCQATARHMIAARSGGAICVVSSCLAKFHSDQNIAYCTSKAALLTMVRSLAAELGVHRIRANSVLPGVIETAMTATVLDAPGQRTALLEGTPLGRTGTPRDVANAIHFLCSDQASFITGAELLVDGGQSLYGQPQWIRQDRLMPHEPRWVSTARP
jgi:NAD(P)-dependent dehydrogenase (short-subunit alcohol dehydrogenase family)